MFTFTVLEDKQVFTPNKGLIRRLLYISGSDLSDIFTLNLEAL